MRILRWLLGILITLVLLIIAAIIIVPKFFDPNDYRDQISTLVKDQTQRDLVIEGDLQLSVFPWLGVSTGKLSLSQPNHLSDEFGGGNMLEVDAANIRLKILPLLKSLTKDTKDIQVDTIVLTQPTVELITTKSGISSLDGLAGDSDSAPETAKADDEKTAASAGAALVVQGVNLASGKLVWDDRQTGQRYELRELNVKTGNLLSQSLADLEVSGELLDSSTPDVTQFDLTGKAQINADTVEVTAADLELMVERGDINAQMRINSVDFAQNALLNITKIASKIAISDEEIGPLDMDLNIPEVNFNQSSQQLNIQSLSAQGEFQGRSVILSSQEVAVDLAKQTANIAALLAELDGVSVNVNQLAAQTIIDNPQFSGRVDVAAFNAMALIQSFDIDFEPQKPSALSQVSFSANVKGGLNAATLNNIDMRLDDSQLKGFFAINDFAKPNIELDLALDKINLDDYGPKSEDQPQQKASSDEAAGLGVLFSLFPLFEQFKANGKFVINDLVAAGAKIQNIKIGVVSKGDSTVITSGANLYDGTFRTTVKYKDLKAGGQLKFAKTNVDSINLQPLLIDTSDVDQLSGKGSLNMDVVVELIDGKQSSQGVIEVGVKDGALKGIDVQKILRKANNYYNQYKGRDLEEKSEESDETQFSSLSGTFNLNDNVLTNSDFDMKAPLFRVAGAGEVDLEKELVDYTTKVSVVNSFDGQGGESLDNLKGLTIPIRFTGPLASPRYSVDMKALAKSLLGNKVKQEKEEYVKRKLGIDGGGEASTKDLLKSALNKKLEEKYGTSEESKESTGSASQKQSSQQQKAESSNDDLNSVPKSNEPAEQEKPKTKDEQKEEAKDELKRKLLESLLGG